MRVSVKKPSWSDIYQAWSLKSYSISPMLLNNGIQFSLLSSEPFYGELLIWCIMPMMDTMVVRSSIRVKIVFMFFM